jgi:type I restriction enzyme S subunit
MIEPGDLMFSNVFAWEGAIAVARPEDAGRVGSHRFMTCVPNPAIATAEFLCFYFLTEEGLERIGEASPGGAGRNRTLGITALERIPVPVPSIDAQHRFGELLAEVRQLRRLQGEADAVIDALLPSVLSKAFSGEL